MLRPRSAELSPTNAELASREAANRHIPRLPPLIGVPDGDPLVDFSTNEWAVAGW